MATIKQLQDDYTAAVTTEVAANAKVDADKVMLTADAATAQDATQTRVDKRSTRDTRLPDGVAFTLDTIVLEKLHGEVYELPIGDPDADLDPPPAPPTP